jgi:hypothetical protein
MRLNNLCVIPAILMLFGLFDSAHIFLTEGSAICIKGNSPKLRCLISKQMTDPSLPLPLELLYLESPSSVDVT